MPTSPTNTEKYLDALPLSEGDRYKLFEGNARRVYPRITERLGKPAK